MTEVDERSRYASITAGARVFALVLLAAPVAFTGQYGPILNVILVAAVWMGAIFVEGLHRIPVMPALVLEAGLVTFLAAWALADSRVLLPAIALPIFIGGMVRGSRGMLEVALAEVVVLAATILPNSSIDRTAESFFAVFTWLMVGIGFGSTAAIVHNLRSRGQTTVNSYRDARALITQLIDLSGELVDGLDPVGISQNILDLTREELPLSGAVVYTQSLYGPTPLVEGDVRTEGIMLREDLVKEVFATAAPAQDRDEIAFPLVTEVGVVAVVAGTLEGRRPASERLRAEMEQVSRRLTAEAVQLDTALLFSTVRDEATAEERHRLARDLHDGVAQDLAALGYLIDGLEETATDAEQVAQVDELRGELTRVVTELRRSIFTLRNDASSAGSLGQSIEALASHIESRSGIPVEVLMDEGETRLRAGVESELLRIAQEAMNNAVKHARASKITVHCTVHAPHATIQVVDDGRGLQGGRDDSHGLRIMRERARRIGADLRLRNSAEHGGVELTVTLAGRNSPTRA